MPIYEYHCPKCRLDFEELVSGNVKVVCPKCGGKKVNKLMSLFAHKSGGEFRGTSGSSCSGCTSSNCSSCH